MMWPDANETQRLLRQVEQLGPAAEEELWERHRPALRRMIGLRLDHGLGRRVDASDVVQEVLLRASRRLGEYLHNPVLPFHLWLRQMARDHVIDTHRKHRDAAKRTLDRERPLDRNPGSPAFQDQSSLDLAAQLQDQALTPAAEAIRGELQRRFQQALAQLDSDDREIILLRHFEQSSNSEAARILGLSEAATGMRHLRALRRLRAVLGESPSLC
jgi:RNA polymerase sigma-70 factor (ECF subfamily)